MNKSVFTIIITGVILFSGCNWSTKKETVTENSPEEKKEIVIIEDKVSKINSEEDFKDLLASKKPAVVKFETMWCGACKTMEPVYKKAAEKFSSVTFVTIDSDKLDKLAKEYEVLGVPTFIFIKDGKVVDRSVGGEEEESFYSKIQKIFE